jgi:hypothetical protein
LAPINEPGSPKGREVPEKLGGFTAHFSTRFEKIKPIINEPVENNFPGI